MADEEESEESPFSTELSPYSTELSPFPTDLPILKNPATEPLSVVFEIPHFNQHFIPSHEFFSNQELFLGGNQEYKFRCDNEEELLYGNETQFNLGHPVSLESRNC
jgi:hypothetical protein